MLLNAEKLSAIQSAFPSEGLFAEKDWLLSPAACTVCEALEETVADANRIPRPAARTLTAV